ncbi:DUF2889 domain-containing protein [Proteobacteria bacterium 005FR1]|nr:DUF2889 domain-containing protein [Proteobacteria bacterium 005FR1]
MSETSARDLPPNPDYGQSQYIRSLIITTPEANRIRLGMEDTEHAFQIDFVHDGQKVTDVVGRWERHPMSGCAGAAGALSVMIGCPLSGDLLAISRYANKQQQCSHLFDMFCFAVAHAWHQREDRRYDVIIPDSPTGLLPITVKMNGSVVLQLAVKDFQYIVEPERFGGVRWNRGFSQWAKENLPETESEYAFIAQRGLFVALARRLDFSNTLGKPAALSGPPAGACYMAQPERRGESYRVGTARDLSQAAEEELLRFVD